MPPRDPATPHERPSPYQLFMLALCIVTLIFLGFSTALPLDSGSREIIEYVDTVACALFFADFLHSLYAAPHRRAYFFKWGWLDLVSSIPVVGPLRVARFARIARLLRVLRTVRSARALTSLILRERKQSALLAGVFLAFLLLACSSIAILQLEAHRTDANIHSAIDAVWWAVTTMSTVGYGDRYPVSVGGRVVGMLLMISGVGIFGALSGLMAAWFLAPDEEKRKAKHADTDREVKEMRELIVALTRDVQSRSPEPHDGENSASTPS